MADLANLDLDSVEALLNQSNKQEPPKEEIKQNESRPVEQMQPEQQDEEQKNGNEREERDSRSSSSHRHKHSKKKSKKRSHSRSKRKHRSRSRSQDRKKRRSKSRSKSSRKHRSMDRRESRSRRSRGSSQAKGEQEGSRERKSFDRGDSEYVRRQLEKQQREEEERKAKELKALEEKLEEAKKQLEDARRDDSTVIIMGLNIKTRERAIYEFFKQSDTGKIRDIRIVKDPKTGKSKGISYVEFYDIESVPKAAAQSGRELEGGKLRIQPSMAEKNRAAAAAKQMKQAKSNLEAFQATQAGPMRIIVNGLTDQLENIDEKTLKDIFSNYGEIEKVEIHRDDLTGKSKGYGFLTFKNGNDGKKAVAEMNDFMINGKQIKVQTVQPGEAQIIENQAIDLDDDAGLVGGGYLHSAQSRQLLMQRLQRGADPGAGGAPQPTGMNPAQGMAIQGQPVAQPRPTAQTSLLPTNCILLSNMFDPTEVDLTEEPGYYVDLKEEVSEFCESFGKVEGCMVEQNSEGNVWLKYSDIKGASNAYQALNNKYFSNRKIICSYVTEQTFHTKIMTG